MATMVQTETQRSLATGSSDILRILGRLEALLPLKKRQQALPPPLRTVHRAILHSLAETGKPPNQAEIAAMLGSRQSALHALAVLACNDLVVLNTPVARDEKTKQPVVQEGAEAVGAYPMTTENTPHRVTVYGHAINAMCAVDALVISPLFGRETWIESRCHVTRTPIRLHQDGAQFLEASPSPEIRVGIRWQSFSTCAAHTLCTEMVFLRDEAIATAWRTTDPAAMDVLTLSEAVELGKAFFLPLLEE
jgi:mercuric reductase